MKKGISLIVLVITIIVMIIIAGAIIISLSSSNIIAKANYAKVTSDREELQNAIVLKAADIMSANDGILSFPGDQTTLDDYLTSITPSSGTYADWELSLTGGVADTTLNTIVTYTNTSGKSASALKTMYGFKDTETLPAWMKADPQWEK